MASTYQTLGNVFNNLRFVVGKDSTTLADSDLIPLSNKYYLQIVRELSDINEDVYGEISTASLVAGQQEYCLPEDDSASTYGGGLTKLLRVEVSYNNTDWYLASPTDMQSVKPALNATDISYHFSQTSPFYAVLDRSLWLYPIPGSADAGTVGGNTNLRIFWVKRPIELAATSDIPNLPKDFLYVLENGMAIDVYKKFGRIAEADRAKQDFQQGLATIRSLEQNTFRPITMKPKTNWTNFK